MEAATTELRVKAPSLEIAVPNTTTAAAPMIIA